MKKIIAVLFVLCLCLTGCIDKREKVALTADSTMEDLVGSTIAIQADSLHETVVKGTNEGINVIAYDSVTDELNALLAGAVDGMFIDEPIAYTYCQKNSELTYIPFVNNGNGFKADAQYYGNACAIVQGSPLKAQINAVLAEIPTETLQTLMQQIIDVNLGNKVDAYVLQSEEPAEYVGVLKVGMECDSQPFNWTDTDGSSLGCVPIASQGKEGLYANGLDVQVAKYIANKLGLKLEVYAIEWDSLIPALTSGSIDTIIGNMSPTEERKKTIDFTSSYFDVNYVVIIKK